MDARQQELIDFLFPRKQIPATTTTTIGTAMSDSESGKVMVLINSDVLSGDGSTNETSTVEMPTTEYVKSGDQVVVTMFGTDVKTPTVTGVYGGGDSINDRVVALEAGGGAVLVDNTSTEILTEAYKDRVDLALVSFPLVDYVEQGAFKGCVNLAHAGFQACDIAEEMFYGCKMLETISVLDAGEIGDYAFYGCSSLTAASFPNVEIVGEHAFDGCKALTDVSLPIATTIYDDAFRFCWGLTRISLPRVTTFSGGYSGTFYGCQALERLDLPSSNVCPNIDSMSPLLVLNFCGNNRTTVPSYNSSIVTSTIAAGSGFVYINDALVNTMKSTTGWSTYASQIRPWSELRC